jgi:hypothetical protein
MSDPLQFLLEPGNCGMWFESLSGIDYNCDKCGVPPEVLTAFVDLADGTTREAPLPSYRKAAPLRFGMPES